MNDSSYGQSGKLPSDEQMDGLLRDFFVLETPLGLKRPFHRPTTTRQAMPTVSIVTHSDSISTAPRGRRLVVASAISVLAMTLLLAFQIQGNSPDSDNAASTAEPVDSSSQLMLVSPNAELKATELTVGEDGVTLQETDSIELTPRK